MAVKKLGGKKKKTNNYKRKTHAPWNNILKKITNSNIIHFKQTQAQNWYKETSSQQNSQSNAIEFQA